LALLTNIVIAWNTHKMQQIVDQWRIDQPDWIDPKYLSRIAPIQHRNINMKGIFQFPLEQYRELYQFSDRYTPTSINRNRKTDK
jgi:hypothetical protein